MRNVSPVILAQLSDLHLFAQSDQTLMGLNTLDSFSTVVEALKTLSPQPHCILLTGDLAQDETVGAYQRLSDVLAPLGIPTYWVAGNHDCLPKMEEVLTRPPISPLKSFSIEDWQVLLLNSAVPGQVYGKLSDQCLTWLERELQRTSPNPTLIALHHPPFAVDCPWLDAIGLRNSPDFFAVIEPYDHVKLVTFGHIHQQWQRQRRQVNFLSAPSTCFQFTPNSPDFALDTAQPGFRLFKLYPDGTFETQVQRVQFDMQLDRVTARY